MSLLLSQLGAPPPPAVWVPLQQRALAPAPAAGRVFIGTAPLTTATPPPGETWVAVTSRPTATSTVGPASRIVVPPSPPPAAAPVNWVPSQPEQPLPMQGTPVFPSRVVLVGADTPTLAAGLPLNGPAGLFATRVGLRQDPAGRATLVIPPPAVVASPGATPTPWVGIGGGWLDYHDPKKRVGSPTESTPTRVDDLVIILAAMDLE